MGFNSTFKGLKPSFLKLSVVGSGRLLVDVMWFHTGCCDVKNFCVAQQRTSCSHRNEWHTAIMNW